MADVGSNTAITVALIAVVGTLGAAYINASAGRRERTPEVPAAVQSSGSSAASTATGTAPGQTATAAAPAATASSPGAASQAVPEAADARAASGVSTIARTEPPPAAPAAPLDMSGSWIDQSGIVYAVEQHGAQFTIVGSGGGAMVAARGLVDGQQIRWSYQNNIGNAGDCEAKMVTPKLARANCTQILGNPYVMLLAKQS